MARRKNKKFTEDEKAIYRLGFLAGEQVRLNEKKTRTAQIIKISDLKQSNLPSLLEILIQHIHQDERKTSTLTRRNIKKILKEIALRTDLPKDTVASIIERD